MKFARTLFIAAVSGTLFCWFTLLPAHADSESGGVYFGAGSESEGVNLGSTESGTPLKEWGETPDWGASSQAPTAAEQWAKGNESDGVAAHWGCGNQSGFPNSDDPPSSESGGVVWGAGNGGN